MRSKNVRVITHETPGGPATLLSSAGYWTFPFGTYAQYAAVEEKDLALLPASVPLDIAAGLPLAGLTAQQALEVVSDVQRSDGSKQQQHDWGNCGRVA